MSTLTSLSRSRVLIALVIVLAVFGLFLVPAVAGASPAVAPAVHAVAAPITVSAIVCPLLISLAPIVVPIAAGLYRTMLIVFGCTASA